MAASTYWFGSLAALLVVATVGAGAWRLRARFVPEWDGPRARLVEAIAALTVVFAVAQVIGTVGWFSRGPMFAGCLLGGAAMYAVGAWWPAPMRPAPVSGAAVDLDERPDADPDASPTARARSRPEELIVVVGAAAVVFAQWMMHTGDALHRGMTHGDTLWYHGPFAARFVQTHHIAHASHTGLEDLATPLHGFLPLNGSLAHAILILPFGYDVLSPLLNLGFFVLAGVAAWCIGSRRGVGALTLLAALVILGLPTLTGTQPGQASNDVVTASLFFVAIALLFEGELRPAPTTFAGLAGGLALGAKLTVLAPLVVITLGVLFLAFRARRWTTAIAWCLSLFFTGGYWLVRNWVIAGNPVPWSEVKLGPITLHKGLATRPALVTVIDERTTWTRFIWPGFRDALGRGWVVVLLLVIIGAVIGIVRGPRGIERVAGASALLGIAALPFVPFSADFGGGIFVFMVRYLVPEYLVGVTLLALALVDGPVWVRRALVAVFAVLIVSDVTSPYIEGARLWPHGQTLTGIVTGFVVVGAAVVVARVYRTGGKVALSMLAVATAIALVVALGGGWFVQRDYLRDRYVDAGLPHDRVNAFFRDVHHERVAAIARTHAYPLFGLDLSNDVSEVAGPEQGSATARCRAWLHNLHGFDYIVLGSDPFSPGPDAAWFADQPGARSVLRDGSETVYRIRQPLDSSRCP